MLRLIDPISEERPSGSPPGLECRPENGAHYGEEEGQEERQEENKK
jgi:hypothetical protein